MADPDRCGPVPTVSYGDARAACWAHHVAGHVVDDAGLAAPNGQGLTYQVSVWRSNSGEQLVLLSEMC